MIIGAIIAIVCLALGLLFGASIVQAAHMQKMDRKEQLYYDDMTMDKVYRSFMDLGINEQTTRDTVARIMNKGILFRERPPNG